MAKALLHLPRMYRVLFLRHGRLGFRSALLNTVFGHLLTTFFLSYMELDISTFTFRFAV